MVQILDVASILNYKGRFVPLNKLLGPHLKLSTDKAPKLEIKALLEHLKYNFLGNDNTLPIILSIGLSDVWVKEALPVLKR